MTMRTEMKVGYQTPWGPAQSVTETAEGIWFVSTASHGGFYLSRERREQIPVEWGVWRTKRWFEEDCEACAVVLAFASEFEDTAIHNAVEGVRMFSKWEGKARWLPIVKWLQGPGIPVLHRYYRSRNETADLWRRGGMGSDNSTPRGYWKVYFKRERDGKRMTVVMPYPEKERYTQEELEQLEYRPSVVLADVPAE